MLAPISNNSILYLYPSPKKKELRRCPTENSPRVIAIFLFCKFFLPALPDQQLRTQNQALLKHAKINFIINNIFNLRFICGRNTLMVEQRKCKEENNMMILILNHTHPVHVPGPTESPRRTPIQAAPSFCRFFSDKAGSQNPSRDAWRSAPKALTTVG